MSSATVPPGWISIATLNEVATIRHAFFTREGGVSAGIYASLNCGLGSADDPARVFANRRRALAEFEAESESLATVYQQHSSTVMMVDEGWSAEGDRPVADALVTRRPGIVLGILTADCAPVLLVDATAGVIGAAHAGWKGAQGGVLENTVTAMVRLGAEPARIVGGIGPCIAQRSYEVGPEFRAAFLAEHADNGLFFVAAPVGDRCFFDLPGYVARRLAQAGVKGVVRTPCDTCREEDRFFSYRRSTRRGETDYGRSLSAIMLE